MGAEPVIAGLKTCATAGVRHPR